MRCALALVVLLCALASRAADTRDPRYDQNGDGVISNKENRQGRRADRRANRAPRERGGAGDDGGSTTEEDAQRQSAAAGKAARMAGAMQSMLPDASAGALPAGAAGHAGSGGAAGVRAGSAPPPTDSSGDPANPRSAADLALAARGAYAPALEKAGLRLGPRGFERVSDGGPATAADLERFRAAVLSMPVALSTRPDFYKSTPPEHFEALQAGYRADPSKPAFKDVKATEKERDFVHSRSCEKMSGDCNPNVKKASYKKGEYVSPEDLERMYKSLSAEIAAAEEEEEGSASPSGAGRASGDAGGAPNEEEAASARAEAARASAAEESVWRQDTWQRAYDVTPRFLPETARRAYAKFFSSVARSPSNDPRLGFDVLCTALGGALLFLFAARIRR